MEEPAVEPAPSADATSGTAPDAHGLGAALGRLMGGSRRTAKAAALVAATRLADGEMVRAAVGGRFRGKDGVAVLTDRQILLANNREWDPEVVSMPTSAAVEVEHWVERRAAILRIGDGTDSHVIDRINDLGVAESLVEALQGL